MNNKEQDRLTMPGEPPTDEDLRHEAELTREELAETVAALGDKADVKARVQKVAHEKAEALRETGRRARRQAPGSGRGRGCARSSTARPAGR